MRRVAIVSALLVLALLTAGVVAGRSRAGGKPAIHAVIPTRDAAASQHVLVVVGKSLKRFASFALREAGFPEVEIPPDNVVAAGGSTLVLRVPETIETATYGSVLLVARNKAGLEVTFPVELTEVAPRIGLYGHTGPQGTAVFGFADASAAGAATSTRAVLGVAAGNDLARVTGVWGNTTGALSTGVLGEGATGVHARSTQTALRATLSAETGDIAVFEGGGLGTVARIDQDGVGYFDGGVQSSGADFAETVAVGGGAPVEPGDVLLVDGTSDRRFRVSDERSSVLVAGVVSTRPALTGGVTDGAAPDGGTTRLAIVGIAPTKVCDEGGPVRRGDMLVSASLRGYAMRAPEHPAPGSVIGKALGGLAEGRGVVEVLLQSR